MATRIVKAKPPIAEITIYAEDTDEVLHVFKIWEQEVLDFHIAKLAPHKNYNGRLVGREEIKIIQS
jgi:hypothetical protein